MWGLSVGENTDCLDMKLCIIFLLMKNLHFLYNWTTGRITKTYVLVSQSEFNMFLTGLQDL